MSRFISDTNPICVYDVTLPADVATVPVVKKSLQELAKKWVFQKERGEEENGYVHYQIRCSLFKPKRWKECVPLFRKSSDIWKKSDIRPTSTNASQKFSYVMKLDTRVEGPWADNDPPQPPLTPTIEWINQHGLQPWMESVISKFPKYEHRTINVIYDPAGDSGKSSFGEWVEYHGLAQELPMMFMMEDLVQFLMCTYKVEKRLPLLIDLPRAVNKDKLTGFFTGIEQIKNGKLYDKRYKGRTMRIARPQVWLFTNAEFDRSKLTDNRWVYWTIKNGELKKWVKPTLSDLQERGDLECGGVSLEHSDYVN